MPETFPISKPEHLPMNKTTAGGVFGVGFKNSTRSFSLVPATVVSSKRIKVLVLLFISVPCVALVPAIHEFTRSPSARLIGYAVVGVCGVSIAAVIWWAAYARAREDGTLMMVDKQSGDVMVPHESRSFRRSEIEHLQVIQYPGKGNHALMTFAELNLIATVGDTRVRCPVAGGVEDLSLVSDAIDALISQTDLPIFLYRIIRQRAGDQVQISDMRLPEKR